MGINIPMFLFCDPNWGEWLEQINKGQFDFVALIHWSGIDVYDFATRNYYMKRIDRENMNALKRLGRMAAEGIIRDDEFVWQ